MRGRALLAKAALLLALSPAVVIAAPFDAAECQFVHGFKALHDAMPDVVGECVENEHVDSTTGDTLQRTTNGLLVYRPETGVRFTDGYRTWAWGPNGIDERLNVERFPWENGAPLGTPTPGASRADDGEGAERTDRVEAIARFFDVDPTTVQRLRAQGLGWGAIVHALSIARAAGRSVDDVVAEHQNGKGWGAIAKESGVHPSAKTPPGKVFKGAKPARNARP